MNQKGSSQFILIVVVGAVLVVAGGSVYYWQSAEQNKSDLSAQVTPESSSNEVSPAPVEQADQNKIPEEPEQKEAPAAVEKKVSTPPAVPKQTGGYTFTIIGEVHDMTDAPAMTSGTPMAGITIRTTGPKAVTSQTQSNGSYTLSFTNAPVGTYDVCVTIPYGYRINPPSGCEIVVVRLLHQGISPNDATLEFENNGNTALNGTAINFNLLRQ